MGRGNVRIGDVMYYVNYDKFTCYFPDENGEDTEERDYDCEIDYQKDFIMNIETAPELLEIFNQNKDVKWFDRETRILLENKFYILAVADNEWSMGFTLIPKDFWDENSIYDFETEQEERDAYDTFIKEQKSFLPLYKKVLLQTLFNFTQELYMPLGPWTSGKITKDMIEGQPDAS